MSSYEDGRNVFEKGKEVPVKEKDFYAKKRRLVPTYAGKELFEKKPAITGTELTSREANALENYAGKLLLVGV